MGEYLLIVYDELRTALLAENYKRRRVQTKQIDGVTYLRAQPRLAGL